MHVIRAVLLAAVLSMVVAAPAGAHTDLVSSTPKDGAQLTSPPQRVTLTFGEDLLTAGYRLVARDSEDNAVDLGPVTVDGEKLSAPWPASAASGQYRVAYRAVASDGHPLEGTVRFTVSAPGAPAQASPAAAQTPAPAGDTGVRWWAPLALIAALAVAGVFVWRSRAH